MKDLILFTSLLLLLVSSINAQNSNLPYQLDYIHTNNVRAAILNGGDNFWDLSDARFQVPYKGNNSPSSIFSSALWLTGYDDNNVLRGSALDYNTSVDYGYAVGPISTTSTIPPDENKKNWNKIFSVHQQDILAHINDAKDGNIDSPIASIFGWPAKGNKFFFDFNGFELNIKDGAFFQELEGSKNGIYEPHLGEYPYIEGMDSLVIPGEIKWCVYNNKDYDKPQAQIIPMGFEIQQTTYALSCEDEILANSIFISYKIINKSNKDYKDMSMAQWVDFDLGCYEDDFVGCSPKDNSTYVYNGLNKDSQCSQIPIPRYEGYLPVQTMTFLNSEMTSFMYYGGGSIIDPPPGMTGPDVIGEFNNYMNGRWKNGLPLTYGNQGYNTGGDTVKYVFPHSPTDTSGWSLWQIGGSIQDYRTISSTKRSEFKHNDVWKIDLAFTLHNDQKSNHIEMVDYALEQLPKLQQIYEDGFKGCAPLELCDCDCVWPGDTDNNGIVNIDDFISIIHGWGKAGSIRKGPLAWMGQSVIDWKDNNANGINLKHADVNGDGKINLTDLDIIPDFLERKTICNQQDSIKNCLHGNDLIWKRRRSKDSLFISNGNSRAVSLLLNNNESFLALSYEIQFDRSLFSVYVSNDSLEWNNNLLGYAKATNNNFTTINVFQSNLDNSNQTLKSNALITLNVRSNHTPSNYPLPFAEIEICNAKMHFTDGSYKELGSQSLKYYFDDSVKIATKKLLAESQISILPNPAYDFVNIQTIFKNSNLIISNIEGKKIKELSLEKRKNNLDISNLKSGIYIFTVRSDEGVVSKKVIIQQE